MLNSFIKTQNGLSMMINGAPLTVDKSHPNFQHILEALKESKFDEVPGLINLAVSIKNMAAKHDSEGDMEVDVNAGIIKYKGKEIHHSMVNIILGMIKDGFNIKPMLKFLNNLYKNPSKKSIDELYAFLEYGKMPITEDGCFIAYKRVNSNFTSMYDNKTKNDIGTFVRMDRRDVDDRSNVTCSEGLHICSYDYLQHYGAGSGKVIVVKVNPEHVVSIPNDYNNTKARVCEYFVSHELPAEDCDKPSHSFGTTVLVDPKTSEDEPTQTDIVESVEESTNDWTAIGYSTGYEHGKNKEPMAEPLMIDDEDSKTWNLTAQDVQDVNDSYLFGYKDGRSHKKRAYPKTQAK